MLNNDNKNLDDAATFCSEWFRTNNVDIPKTAKEWSKGRSGKTVPPLHTYESLRRRGVSVGDLLEKILPGYLNRVSSVKLPDDEVLRLADLTYISRSSIETIHYICNGCEEEKQALLGTIKRWITKEQKHCSECREAPGKIKSLGYYQTFLSPEYVPIGKRGRDLLIKHTECGTEFYRATGYIAGAQRVHDQLICCPTCSNHSGFVYNRQDGFMSLVEKDVITHLEVAYPGVTFSREVKYKEFLNTIRDFRIDLWLPEFNIGIEITSNGNNLPKYKARLEEKIQLAAEQGIKIYVVKSKKQLDDIVQSLLKDKE